MEAPRVDATDHSRAEAQHPIGADGHPAAASSRGIAEPPVLGREPPVLGEPLSAAARVSFARTGLLVVGGMGGDMCKAVRKRVLAQIAASHHSDICERAEAVSEHVGESPPAGGGEARAAVRADATPPTRPEGAPAAKETISPQAPAASPSGKGVSPLRQTIARRHVRRAFRARTPRRSGGAAAAAAAARGLPSGPPPGTATVRVQHRSAAMLMTVHERRVVLQQRTLLVLAALSNGLSLSATMHIKLGLVGNNAGRIATSTGQQLALISLCNLLLGPVVAGASDRFGRLPFMYLSVIGRLGWSASLFAVRSIERYQEWGVAAFGVLGAGAGSVQHAALDDLFGSRPALNAQVQARNSAWTSAVGLIAPILGAEIGRRSLRLALVTSLIVGGLQIPLMLLGKETLQPSQRKPFRLSRYDPLSNLSVLFCNGAELRRLALANLLLQGSAWSQQTMQSFQIGSLSWTPADQSYYGSFQSLLGIMSQGSVVMPLLSRLGSKRAFELGSLFSAAGLLLVSQAGRPLSASKLRKTAQLGFALLVMVPGHVCGLAMRTMIVKQAGEINAKAVAAAAAAAASGAATAVDTAGIAGVGVGGGGGVDVQHGLGLGRGELNAALNGLRSLLSVAMPLAWGWFCNFCFEGRGGAHWWCAPGAQFILAAALRLLSRQLVATCNIVC